MSARRMLFTAIVSAGMLTASVSLADDVVVVEVTGEGVSQDAARQDALRKARADADEDDADENPGTADA